MIKAVNPKYQKAVNDFVKWDKAYEQEVNKNAEIGKDTSPAQDRAYEKAFAAWQELPKYEQDNLSKNMDTIGY